MRKAKMIAALGGGFLIVALLSLAFSAIGALIGGTVLWLIYTLIIANLFTVPALAWWMFFVGWLIISFIAGLFKS